MVTILFIYNAVKQNKWNGSTDSDHMFSVSSTGYYWSVMDVKYPECFQMCEQIPYSAVSSDMFDWPT